MTNQVVLLENRKETVTAFLNEGTITESTVATATGDETGYSYSDKLSVGDFVSIDSTSEKDKLVVCKFDSTDDLPHFGMIINEPKVVDNGVREAGILILGVINRFKVDDTTDISVNDRLGIDEDCVKPCENGFLYAMFDVDVSEYNYVDAFLPWKMYENVVPESAKVYPIDFDLTESSSADEDYWGVGVPENGDKGDYFIKTNQGDGFGKVLTIAYYFDDHTQPCEREDAVGTAFFTYQGVSWSCPEVAIFKVDRDFSMSYVSKSDLPAGIKINDYVVGVSRVYKVYSETGSSFILQTMQDIVIETSNIGKTNMSTSSEDWSMGYIRVSTIKMRGDAPVKVGDIIVNTNNQKAYKVKEGGSYSVTRDSNFEYDIGTY